MKKFITFINEMSKTVTGTILVVAFALGIFFIMFGITYNIAHPSPSQVVASTINYKLIKCDNTHYLYIPNNNSKHPQMFTIEQVDSIINN